MKINPRFTENRFTVLPDVVEHLRNLVSRGTILIHDPTGTSLYHGISKEQGLVGRRDSNITWHVYSMADLVSSLVDHLESLTRDEAFDADWIGDEDFTSLADQVRDLYLWIQLGWANEEITQLGTKPAGDKDKPNIASIRHRPPTPMAGQKRPHRRTVVNITEITELHNDIVRRLFKRWKSAEYSPATSTDFDLAVDVGMQHVIFEVKTTTDSNFPHQLRLAVGQLMDYRWKRKQFDRWGTTFLVVCVSHVPAEYAWYAEFLRSMGIGLLCEDMMSHRLTVYEGSMGDGLEFRRVTEVLKPILTEEDLIAGDEPHE